MDMLLCFLTFARWWHCSTNKGNRKTNSHSKCDIHESLPIDQNVTFISSQLKSYSLKIRLINFIESNIFNRTITIKVLTGH